jgi:hypothetical protein
MADIIPPRAQECVITPRNLLGKRLYALIIKWWESAEQSVKDTSQRPHVNTFAIPLILDNFWSRVTHGATRGHRFFIPHDLGETKIGDLDATNTATANSRNELTFVFLFIIVGTLDEIKGRNNLYPFKQEVFGLDIAVYDASFFVKITDALSYLEDDVPGKVFGKVSEPNDLMK